MESGTNAFEPGDLGLSLKTLAATAPMRSVYGKQGALHKEIFSHESGEGILSDNGRTEADKYYRAPRPALGTARARAPPAKPPPRVLAPLPTAALASSLSPVAPLARRRLDETIRGQERRDHQKPAGVLSEALCSEAGVVYWFYLKTFHLPPSLRNAPHIYNFHCPLGSRLASLKRAGAEADAAPGSPRQPSGTRGKARHRSQRL